MYTQCPECLAIFSLDGATLAQARGSVGCGQCGATFDATATLAEELPPEPFDSLTHHPASPSAPVLMMAILRPAPAQSALFEPEQAGGDVTPSFARHRRAVRRPRHTLRWALGCLLLGLLLSAQLAWAERGTLLRDPATAPWLTQAAHVLGVTLPPTPDLSRLQLLSRDIRPHPSVPGALLITATLRNDAPFTQPYPVIAITLSNLDDQRVAMRRFRPSEYMRDAHTRANGLAPGATTALMFEVRDPGQNAVAFQFGFEWPGH